MVTVVGQVPDVYRQNATSVAADAGPAPAPDSKRAPSPLRRLGARVRDDFRRSSPIVRLVFVALPAVAWSVLALGEPETTGAERRAAIAPRPNVVAPAAGSSAPLRPTGAATDVPLLAAPSTPGPRSATAPGGRTDEARAADAAARGAYVEAIALYESLASAHPDRPEFGSAARILKTERDRTTR
jgi:hypothetical protein